MTKNIDPRTYWHRASFIHGPKKRGIGDRMRGHIAATVLAIALGVSTHLHSFRGTQGTFAWRSRPMSLSIACSCPEVDANHSYDALALSQTMALIAEGQRKIAARRNHTRFRKSFH